jgi:pimeloyl-ACP methyl ester carboxylesterase
MSVKQKIAMTHPTLVVFITGTFVGNNCWDDWKSYFESYGYKCIAPSWPHKDEAPEVLRKRHPDMAIASNRLETLIEFYESIVASMPGKPIAIGHSLGGLIVQLLIQRGLVAAGVAIHSFPPPGVCQYKFSFLRGLWDVMDVFSDIDQSYMMPFRKWQRTVANGMTCDLQKEFYYLYAIPESKSAVRDTFNWSVIIDFNNPHSPLLFTSGTQDKIVPASVNFCNYKKYDQENSITAFKEFKGHNHLVFGQPAAMEEAKFILFWLYRLNK